MLPNLSGIIVVLATLQVGIVILVESALSYLGLGVPPPAITWGSILAGGKDVLTAGMVDHDVPRDRDHRRRAPRQPARRCAVDVLRPEEAALLMATPVIDIRGLTVEARLADRSQVILDDLDLPVEPGEVIGVVGESGSGKTTLVRSLVGLLDKNVEVVQGRVDLAGKPVLSPGFDETKAIRGGEVGVVFQDAARSLDPLFKVKTQLKEVLAAHRGDLSRTEIRARMTDVLARMKIADPGAVLDSYPHHLSGGLAQRVAIAVAVVTEPRVVLADECTTALDVTTQAEVVSLLRELVDESRVALVFVTHNILLAADLCDRVVVMYAGQAVETGPVGRVLRSPQHPYTAALLASLPTWNGSRAFRGIPGAAPRVSSDTVGCRFAARCARVAAECTTRNVPGRRRPAAAGTGACSRLPSSTPPSNGLLG